MPKHVAIIMDGNGRWAERRGMERSYGHRAGAEAIRAILRSSLEENIPILSLFAFSSENWLRPSHEVDFLMQLFLDTLKKETANLHDNGIKVCFLGDRQNLSPDVLQQMQETERLTSSNDKMRLNFALNYGGRWDIAMAARKLTNDALLGNIDANAIDDKLFEQYLSTAQLVDPDLLIRTSGEKRISNFFLWQIAYTEIYFTPTLWPEFGAKEFAEALQYFRHRERRYGRTTKQLLETEDV